MARFVDLLAGEFKPDRAAMTSLDVPELGDGVRVFWRPAWTLGERQEAYVNVNRDGVFGVAVDTLIAKALDEKGAPLFDTTPATRNELMREVRPAIVERIAAKMLETLAGVATPELAEAEQDALAKN